MSHMACELLFVPFAAMEIADTIYQIHIRFEGKSGRTRYRALPYKSRWGQELHQGGCHIVLEAGRPPSGDVVQLAR